MQLIISMSDEEKAFGNREVDFEATKQKLMKIKFGQPPGDGVSPWTKSTYKKTLAQKVKKALDELTI